ncbi:M20/M25/M40 family metallo-hydrolase [Paratractidigestivibacter sp.]|uniref:M20/M25/M40 family metallo-hydrolase n=1 Tax=Paratractidigestivibacter sp. TaxID=2847316 RepID=UPI002ABD5726|nr:M20/M25/M40 family metallo-hydrolase [Paratractidigestivibacter sp.]
MEKHVIELASSYAKQAQAEELDLLRKLARIPAPTGHEEKRAAFVRDWLLAAGADEGAIAVDAAKNVVLTLPGADRGSCAVFSAHTDVVAADTEELPFTEDEGRMYAPGVGDDTANLCGLLMAAKWLLANKPQLKRDVLIVANACEEGLGNLRGTREIMAGLERRGVRAESFTSFDLYLGKHITGAVGSHRWRVRCRCAGGHSWEDAGAPSAVLAASRVVCGLYALPLPYGAKTSVNAGCVSGGTTVNAIATEAEVLLEYRSANQENLEIMRKRFEQMVGDLRSPGVDIETELIGERPASTASEPEGQAELIAAGDEAIRALTGTEPVHQESSTDANVPLSLGVAAHTMGAVAGALLHTRDEWIDKASLEPGLALTLGHILDTQVLELS